MTNIFESSCKYPLPLSEKKKGVNYLPEVFPLPLQNHFLSVLSNTTDAGS